MLRRNDSSCRVNGLFAKGIECMKQLFGIDKCPHLNCLVYHYGNPCTCDMKRYCHICNPIELEKKEDLSISKAQRECTVRHDVFMQCPYCGWKREEKEERCTKCNGVGWTRESVSSTAENIVCPHCNGTGIEPKKSCSGIMVNCPLKVHTEWCNGCFNSCPDCKEPRKDTKVQNSTYSFDQCQLDLKIAVEALESLKLYFDVSECECGEKESDTDGALYVNEALEKLNGKSNLNL